MSSETSTDQPRLSSDGPAQAAFQPWQLFTLAGLIGATIAVFTARGESAAGVILISLTVFAASAVGLAALRTFLPLTRAEAPERQGDLGERARATLEREKTLALRTIKELEFDRAMGKVSERDYAEMIGRLRARAARLIRQVDVGGGYRQDIEREVAARLAADRSGAPAAVAVEAQPAPAVPAGRCAACGTLNDTDARFCKQCGKALADDA